MLSDKRLRHEVCRNVLTHRGLYIEERDAIFCRDYSIQNLAVYMLAMTELFNKGDAACSCLLRDFCCTRRAQKLIDDQSFGKATVNYRSDYIGGNCAHTLQYLL